MQFKCNKCNSNKLKFVKTEEVCSKLDEAFVCQMCGESFPIKDGIPRFVPSSNYANSFGFQWNIHAKTQLDSFSGLTVSRDRIFNSTRWPKNLSGQRILEAGSGAGRFTEILLETGAHVVTFDYSSACEANQQNNKSKGKDNLTVFQGDIFNIPLAECTFDKVLCLGVLQHTPDPESAFTSLCRFVKPGGSLVIDCYTQSIGHWLQWKYILRPITTKIDQNQLYYLISKFTPVLVPIAALLYKVFGRFGRRLLPIVQYEHLGLSKSLNIQWSILDTFDMYAPAHDHPQSPKDIKIWFEKAGFIDIDIRFGPNGVVGTGVRPIYLSSVDYEDRR
jgi:SAM-dependent methyltransferase